MIAHKPFGKTAAGQTVDEYTITNAGGSILKVITYGGIVTELHVPDRQGKLADVVCGLDNLDQYLAGHPYFGCVVGRVAGRISGATFALDGKTYPLAVNDPPNHLHGGVMGFDKKVWLVDGTTTNSVSMIYTSADGEEGYPGKVTTRMTYALTDANEFTIDYEAVTDKATPLCLTNHSYFNLAGESSGQIMDHVVQIHATSYAPADEKMTLLGRRENVTAGVMLKGVEKGKAGQIYAKHAAFCLEAQRYADGANYPELGDVILRPGQTYRQTTVHAFTAE